jgi:hypothetical protein
VQVAISDAEIDAGLNPKPDESSSEILVERRRASTQTRQAGNAMDPKVAVRAALKAGVFGVLISVIPLLGIVLTGALAVFLYRRENGFTLPTALGARLGGAAGVVAFAINAALFTIWIFVFHNQQQYTDYVLRISQQFGGNATDPEVQARIHNMFTSSGLATTVFFLFLAMIFSVALASIGGALASLFMRPSNPRV